MARDAWSIPQQAQPDPDQLGYDLEKALDAVVQLRSEVPSDAFTAGTLGTERHGNGVVISERGLLVTIGYLVTEAQTIWLTTNKRQAIQGHVLGYDFATGFGLIQALGRLDVAPLPLGSISDVDVGDPLVVAAGGGRQAALQAHAAGKREFAGYWEYMLEEALFTVPAHPHWGGTAVIDSQGKLAGIGSLLIQAELGDNRSATGNMVVPIDLLPPVLEDLQRYGRPMRSARPWLGLYATDTTEGLIVTGTAPGGPAAKAGIEDADQIIEVAGEPVEDLSDLWRRVWAQGEAGATMQLALKRQGKRYEATVHSSDRAKFLKGPQLH